MAIRGWEDAAGRQRKLLCDEDGRLIIVVPAGGIEADVTDRAGREVGKVQLTDFVDDGEVYPDGSIPIAPAKVEVASLDSLVGVAAFFDAVNLALNTDHRGSGTQSVEWDKAGTNIASGVQITLPAALDLTVYSTHAQVMWYGLIPDPAPDNVTQVYVALGTDNANYFYWAIPAADIHLGVFWHYHHLMSEVDGIFGVGADLSSVTWAAIVVITDAVGSTFANARVDQIVVKRSTEVVMHVCNGETIPTEDTGVNTNPEKYRLDHHWGTDETLELDAAATPQNLGPAVAAGKTLLLREVTVDTECTGNVVVEIGINLGVAGEEIKLRIPVPAQSPRMWSSQDGREFAAGEQPQAQVDDITGGSTFLSAAGLEA